LSYALPAPVLLLSETALCSSVSGEH